MRFPQHLRVLLLAALLLTSGLTHAFAQGGAGGGAKLPVPFGPTNAGREFWLSFPTNWDASNVATKYIRLYITAGTKTQVDVTAGGFSKSIQTIPYDIVTVDLPTGDAQAIVRDDRAPVPMDQVYKKKGVHIKAGAPIVVYGLNRTSYTTDGLLALPINALGREYIVASAADIADGSIQKLPSQYLITAPYDGTTVTIIHPMDSPNHVAGQAFTVSLDQGDVFSAMSTGPQGDLTGAWITSNKPIAVTAGQNCTYLPDFTYCCCDHLEEMLLPVSSWGKFYQSVPYTDRTKADMFRIFAAEPDTKLYINGILYGTMTTKGGPQGGGWFEYLPSERALIEFSADKPIAVAQYNNSQAYDGSQTDPFYVVLTPVEQYQTELVFATPSFDYTKNYVSIVCDSLGYFDMEIAAGGSNNWEKVSKKFGPFTRPFKTKVNGKTYVGTTLPIVPGTYRLRGKSPFAGYIYGFSAYDSYGYPLSVAVGDLSIKDTVPPTIIKKIDCDGNVDASSNDYPDPDMERSNLSSVELEDGSDNYELLPLPANFQPGISRATTYKLRVIDKTKDAVAYLIVSDMAGNATQDTIRYTAFNVVVDPTPLAFGNFLPGGSAEKTITIKNLSPAPIDIKQAKLKLRNAGFTLIEPIGPFTLGPVGSPTANVVAKIRFDATIGGQFSDSLGLEDACGFRNMALVTASVGTPIIKVSDMDWEKTYGPTLVGTPAKDETIVVRNASTDGGTLTVYPPKSGPYDPVFTTPDGLPLTQFDLAPGQTRVVKVGFRPTAAKRYVDSIVFPNNAPPNPANDSVGVLIGRGIAPGLQVTSYAWGRKRVGTGPYYDTLMLTNTGSAPVRLLGTNKRVGDAGDFGIPDSTVLFLIIDVGASVKLPVYFAPKQIGNRELSLYYSVDGSSEEYVSTLSGIGIIPRLKTEDVDFGSMRVNDPSVQRKVRFFIPPDVDGFTDSVMITGLVFRGTDLDFSSAPADTAVTLIPGVRDTLLFNGFFAATTGGTHTTTIAALTPDPLGATATGEPSDTVSAWQGIATSDAGVLTVTNANKTICRGDTALMTVTISNTSAEAVTVNQISLDAPNDFTLMSGTTQFTLQPNTTRDVTVRYVPTTLNQQIGKLIVESNAKEGRDTAILTGNSTEIVVPATVEMSGTKGKTGELSKEIYAAVRVEAPITPAVVTSYRVTFTYDPKLLFADTNSLSFRIGGANPSAVATFNAAASSRGKLVVDVVSSTPVNLPGELIRATFRALFDVELKRSVSADVAFPDDQKCARVTAATGTIELEPLCGLNLRLIELSAAKYALGQNSPNPGGSSTKIDYSLGLDGPTTLTLYNSEGQIIQTLISEHQQPGKYELTIDATNLPSGSYFYKLVSGDWTQTKRMDIAK